MGRIEILIWVIIATILGTILVVLGTGSHSHLEERHEHDGVTCVYRVKTNFWGSVIDEKRVACE